MKLSRFALPALALGAATTLVFPTRTEGFDVFGDTLDLAQRDFRIWNNFTDPEANDNQVPDADFPGSLGAELALRKGVAEWGSRAHGSGRTDPSQDTIGSGASNFDSMFSAESLGPGNKNANVISMRDGAAFIKASTELPIRDGWRIRFWEDPWVWNDGPEDQLFGGADAYDLQGVAAHEYGHALGLAHSTDPDATMFASAPHKGLGFRSIEADDIAGVQFLYGVLSPTKPRIDGYVLAGGSVEIHGANFAPTDNQVWFTHAQSVTGPEGDPVRKKHVLSAQGGTRIRIPIPALAGPGDIMVRVPGGGHERLSNALPFDPLHEHTDPPLAYGAGKITSSGNEARLAASTLPSSAIGTFQVHVSDAKSNNTAILFSGPSRAELPFQGGILHVRGPIVRHETFQISFFGDATVTTDVPPGALGTARYYQVWFVDPGDPFGSGLTNGLRIEVQP